MVQEEEEVVVMVSFVFKSSSLLAFDVLFVAFGSSSSCSERIDDVAVVVVGVVVVVVVGLVGVAFCFPSSVLEDDPGVDNDFKLSLGAVDEVSVALPSVSTGVEDLEFESIPVARLLPRPTSFSFCSLRGFMPCPRIRMSRISYETRS